MQRLVLLVVCGLTPAGTHLHAALPTDSGAMAAMVGNPVALDIEPPEFTLAGPRASRQVLVTGSYADGTRRDLTCFCDWKAVDPDVLDVTPRGLVTGRIDGSTYVEVRAAGLDARVPVTVKNSRKSQLVGFRHEVMPVLSVAGCSDIRCHGAPSGKGGFRLSLWGGDPDLDYRQLTRGAYGRRTSPFDPENGLILLKALSRVSHVGGQRFKPDSRLAKRLRDWQTEGVRDDPPPAELRSLTVVPSRRVLYAPTRWQQLAVRATFGDGDTGDDDNGAGGNGDGDSDDVTRRTTFTSSDLSIAHVDRTGLVEFKRQGEVAILCRFLGRMASVRLMHIASPPPEYRWSDPPEDNFVDTHVFAKLKMLNIAPSELCSDEQFVRRLHLDLCGILPTPAETRTFLSATEPDKRARLVDQLLKRPEYADYWTKKWMDVLRASRDSIQWAGSQAYHGWLREQIKNDASFADVVQAMLSSVGESYRDPAVNFFCAAPTPKEITDPHYLQKDLAEATAQLFLGIRLQCARCHDHPYERWTQDDYLGLAAFFTQVKRSRLGEAGPKGRPDRRTW